MKKIDVTRFDQKNTNHCAIAACATVANYFNDQITYENIKSIAKYRINPNCDEGLWAGDIAKLLNLLGFQKVTFVSSDLHYLDYSWQNLSKNKLINKMRYFLRKYDGDNKEDCRTITNWLASKKYDNRLIIDYDFSKYIKKSLDKQRPLVLCFNWTMLFKQAKLGDNDRYDDIKGEWEGHAVVAYEYNEKGVYICDSNDICCKPAIKQKKGFYYLSWEHLLSAMGYGDLYLVEKYVKKNSNNR